MWEKFVGMCKLCFMNLAKFCGYVHGKNLITIKFHLWKKFCWVCDVGAWKILWLSFWLCDNLFVHVLVGIFFIWSCRNFFFLHGYGKIWWLYGYVKNLVVVTFCVALK